MTSAELSNNQASRFSLSTMRQAWLSIDQNEQAIAFVRTFMGKVILHLAFMVVMAMTFQMSAASLVLIGVALFGVAAFPAYRMQIVVGASLFYVMLRPFRIDGWKNLLNTKADALPFGLPAISLQVGAVGLFLLIAAGYLLWQNRNKDRTLAKRPVIALLTLWAAILGAAWTMPQASLMSAILWSTAGVFISCFWVLAYAAVDQKTKDPTPTLMRAAFMRPFWGGSATPIGKNFGYLNKFDAKNDDELAATRLKALKLIVWTAVLVVLSTAVQWVVHDLFMFPRLQTAIVEHADNQSFGGFANWVSLLSNYFIDLMIIAIWGHAIVATVRMLGYRIPRNTRNPLAARTLADFWNRYFYYFKELLVDFFFYPAFVRYFKKNTKLRIAFATFCAAGLGNFLYHFTRETYVFAELPLVEALPIFQSAVFYSLALATGLIISQWRGVTLKPEDGFLRYEVLPRLNVIAFFCFLKIFDDITGEGSLMDRASFTASLFGI